MASKSELQFPKTGKSVTGHDVAIIGNSLNVEPSALIGEIRLRSTGNWISQAWERATGRAIHNPRSHSLDFNLCDIPPTIENDVLVDEFVDYKPSCHYPEDQPADEQDSKPEGDQEQGGGEDA